MIQKKPQNSLLQLKNEEKKHFFAQKFGGSKKRDYFCSPVLKKKDTLVHGIWYFVLGPLVLISGGIDAWAQRVFCIFIFSLFSLCAYAAT